MSGRCSLALVPEEAEPHRLRPTSDASWTLTEAELRVLRLLPEPLSYSQIGEQLGMSVGTVRTRAVTSYRVLGAVSRNEAVGRARELGLV